MKLGCVKRDWRDCPDKRYTPYANYKPLNLVTLLKEIQPFLLSVLEYAERPHDNLQATILEQDNKIIKLSNKILDVEEEAAKTQRQLSNKILDVKEEAARTQRQLSNKIYSIKEELRKAKEKAAKSENMNVVYNFVHSVEQILCHCLFGSFFNGTITQALNSGKIKWPEVQAVLKCQDINKECLLKTIHKIKGQRLEYGHTSKSTAMELVLSERLIPIASEHFSLHRNKIDVLQKLLAWILPELPASATLKDLKTEA
ncbi:hypothetical protein PCASD_02552 [Puccinia coronata f. sp. avenae]|uniref:Uncharacterized protein n=1 Tax=Puccinia coronata f. sp. avenae TaxID=200324 RepID=A0A2N5VBI0_9BASI|nr:hypothetical protein PCASD_02552 [Puccinia coronata f. sp. avenae]